MNPVVKAITTASILVLAWVSPSQAEKILKLNESQGLGSPEDIALAEFRRMVETESNGELKIAIHLQDALGKPAEAIEALSIGALDLYSGALEYYATIIPEEINITSLPYLFQTQDELRTYLNSEAFKAAEQKMVDRGIRFISTEWNGDRGPYRVLVSSKPVLQARDLEGLKVRMFPNEIYSRSWEHLGATPIQIAWGETYLAIRQGVVDAVTSPLSGVHSMKFTEVAPYVVEIREYPQTWPMTISERTWNRLTEAERDLLVRAANNAGKVYAEITAERAENDVQAMMRQNNAVVIRLNTDSLRAKIEPLYSTLADEGKISRPIYESIIAGQSN